jgi:hypothetical protein
MLMKLEHSRQTFEKKALISNFIKIRSVGDEMFHADGRTDKMKLLVAFRNFANVTKDCLVNNINNWSLKRKRAVFSVR